VHVRKSVLERVEYPFNLGVGPAEILLDVLESFPTYNLCCIGGIQEAIEDIEERFVEVGAHEQPDINH